MRINMIGSDSVDRKRNTSPNFKALIKDSSVLPIINSLSENDTLEFKQIEKRLSKTKFWDMKISSIKNRFNELKFHFINKSDNKKIITDGIYPYDRHGNSIKFYSIVYGPENTSFNSTGTLKFQSELRARELYNAYRQNVLYSRSREYNLSPVESLKMKEVELNMLDEASEIKTGADNKNTMIIAHKTKTTVGNGFSYKKD